MTKPRIEDFIPPGWYAAMDQSGDLIISTNKPSKLKRFWAVAGVSYTQIDAKHAAMFDLSIFGDNWGESLFQKPPERGNIECPFCGCREFEYKYTNNTWQHEVGGCPLAGLCFDVNEWSVRPKKPSSSIQGSSKTDLNIMKAKAYLFFENEWRGASWTINTGDS